MSPVHTAESDDSDIKIADFGFAKRITDLLPKETACGTPGYVAPEILRGDRYGAEVDIWRCVRGFLLRF
jgi:serine/threonine protein kinase